MADDAGHDARVVVLDGGVNFRDLGGYRGADGRRIRWHHLFRSGLTHRLSAADRRRLTDIGIRVAVDLRSAPEQREHPHALAGEPHITYLGATHPGLGGNLTQLLRQPDLQASHLREEMLELYRNLPYQFADVYRVLFQHIADGPLPLVFSCAAGKDRTGVAAALVLYCLGVAWEDIEADYLLTERFMPQIMQAVFSSNTGRHMAHIDPHVVIPVFSADRAYLQAMRAAIDERSGSLDGYCRAALGLSPELVAAIRGRLLI